MPQFSRPFLAALAALLSAPALARAALPPAGQNYKLTVTTSFEPSFTDCWSFAPNGTQIYSNRLHYFAYQLTGLNTNANQVQALWQGRVSIGFSAVTNGSTITGNGIDAYDRTYQFTGKSVTGCAGQKLQGTSGFMTK